MTTRKNGRRTAMVRKTSEKPRAPDWLKWGWGKSVTLEDAAALSLGADPVWEQFIRNPPEDLHSPGLVGRRILVEYGRPNRRLTVKWSHPSLTDEGHNRLCMLREHYGSRHLPAGESVDGVHRVLLQDLARFAKLQGWNSPQPLLDLATGQEREERREPKEKLDVARRRRILAVLREHYGDTQQLPLYLGGSPLGDPVMRLLTKELGIEKHTIRPLLRDLNSSGEIGPRDRQRRKGDPALG
ncbi:MAG: hypothetical protein U1E60_31585 [Reyranellaceae bacterium]